MRDRGRDLRTTLELVRANSSAECGSFCRAHRAAARGVCNSTRKAASPRRVTTCMQVMDATDAAVQPRATDTPVRHMIRLRLIFGSEIPSVTVPKKVDKILK